MAQGKTHVQYMASSFKPLTNEKVLAHLATHTQTDNSTDIRIFEFYTCRAFNKNNNHSQNTHLIKLFKCKWLLLALHLIAIFVIVILLESFLKNENLNI